MKLKHALFGLAAIVAIAACQKEPTPFMTLSDKTIAVGFEGGKVTFGLASNVYYRVNNDIEWATISITGQEGDSTIFTLDVKENAAFEARESQIRFIGDYVTPLMLKVRQAGTPRLGLDPEAIQLNYFETSAQVVVYSDQAWTASISGPGFSINKTSGNGDDMITVSLPTNGTDKDVTGSLSMTTRGVTYTCAITQKGRVVNNLAADGQTSNCYIVSIPGGYKFPATVRGNGYEPESSKADVPAAISPKGAKVLWSTYNTTTAPKNDDEILTGVSLSDGFIFFETASTDIVPANVIIAAYDDAACTGTILWTWHIWVTDQPKDETVGYAAFATDWMDRNLGATCPNIDGDPRSIGLFYQWGRKDPMRTVSTYTMGDFIATCPAFTVDEVAVSPETGTIAASIANPMPFINTFPGGAGPKDWVYDTGNHDRWMDGEKTMFDPCPPGYKVPSSAQLAAFGACGGIPSGSQKGDAYKNAYRADIQAFKTDAWSLPMGGMMSYNDGTKIVDYGVQCRMETSTWNKQANTLYLNVNGSACNFTNNATAGHASGIRCIKQ